MPPEKAKATAKKARQSPYKKTLPKAVAATAALTRASEVEKHDSNDITAADCEQLTNFVKLNIIPAAPKSRTSSSSISTTDDASAENANSNSSSSSGSDSWTVSEEHQRILIKLIKHSLRDSMPNPERDGCLISAPDVSKPMPDLVRALYTWLVARSRTEVDYPLTKAQEYLDGYLAAAVNDCDDAVLEQAALKHARGRHQPYQRIMGIGRWFGRNGLHTQGLHYLQTILTDPKSWGSWVRRPYRLEDKLMDLEEVDQLMDIQLLIDGLKAEFESM